MNDEQIALLFVESGQDCAVDVFENGELFGVGSDAVDEDLVLGLDDSVFAYKLTSGRAFVGRTLHSTLNFIMNGQLNEKI